jgi:hypothetical protein
MDAIFCSSLPFRIVGHLFHKLVGTQVMQDDRWARLHLVTVVLFSTLVGTAPKAPLHRRNLRQRGFADT